MKPPSQTKSRLIPLVLAAVFLLTLACSLPNLSASPPPTEIPLLATLIDMPTATLLPQETPAPALPTPPSAATQLPLPPLQEMHQYDLVPYTAQSGDTLPVLAARFRTSSAAIAADNPHIPDLLEISTLPPGEQMLVRLAVEPFWDEPHWVLPDSLFVYGPAQIDFDTEAYLSQGNGWLGRYVDRNGPKPMTGAQIVERVARQYSISPRLILALLEYHLGALTNPVTPGSFFLGSNDAHRSTLPRQLSWVANTLNNGYYGWRAGVLLEIDPLSGPTMVPSPWQNAASVALQHYFSRFSSMGETLHAISPSGVSQTYQMLFGPLDWTPEVGNALIPADLQQPAFILPLQPGLKWAFTAGPHSGWGIGQPWAAIDFAPPSEIAGCDASPHWALAAADGIVARSEEGLVLLDLDGDGSPLTGWVVMYLHMDPVGAASAGQWLRAGDRIGHPSCVGGTSTGRNVHIARLYNGEWIPAGGPVPLQMGGWVVVQGESDYKGYLLRDGQQVFPSSLGEGSSTISAEP